MTPLPTIPVRYDRFPPGYVNDIRGWAFDQRTIRENAGKLLTLDIDFGSTCTLNCPSCFRKNSSIETAPERALGFDELVKVIREAKPLGLRSVKFLGAGEPFENHGFLDFLRFLKSEDVIPLIFTKGHVLGDDALVVRNFGYLGIKTSEALVDALYECGASIMLGFNSFNDKIQAKMVGAPIEYVGARNRALAETREKKRVERQMLLGQAWQDLLDIRLQARREQLQVRQGVLTQKIKEQGRLQSKVGDLQTLLDTSECPTCGQELTDTHRTALGRSLGELQIELSNLTDGSEDLQVVSAQLVALNRIRGVNARERLAQIDKDIQAVEVDMTRVENEIERIRDEIAGHDTAELARKRVLHTEALKEEGRLQGEINNAKRDIEKVREELAVAQKAIESLAPARTQRSTLKVSIATELERTFAASIETLRDRLRERVGALANDAFKKMTTQKAYRGLEINSNYGLHIIDGIGRRVPLRSAGAEQVVALSLIDGLNRTGRAVGPVVMDTPFARLDLKHRDNILAYLPTVTSQFVLLVHSGEVRPETDLEVIKPRIGAVYTIREVTPTQSRIERSTL